MTENIDIFSDEYEEQQIQNTGYPLKSNVLSIYCEYRTLL